ncbi:hypothetical protein Cni_G16505 [Canna indica]|uniref:Uncharacterized protein n=1 Tax=Canna indica TaxID=4628 RepID=A0AAQ3KF83_9LILI|nr:hypothetical protein Cni_G16505 [Canna indica]
MEDVRPRGGSRDDLEIASIGVLYRGPWDKKYWSSSRGKDRYPYPVGYQAIRTHGGNTYQMEIHEGSKGPLFKVTSADGESSTGQTPDIAWKHFQKKNGLRVKDRDGKQFSSKVDGVELFGFQNPFVKRLLREVVSNGCIVAESDVLSSLGNEAPRLDDKMQTRGSFVCNDSLVYSKKYQTSGKRSTMNITCTKVNSKTTKTKRLRSQYVLNDSALGDPHQENAIFSHSEISSKKIIKENSIPSSRNLSSQIQGSQNYLSYSPKGNICAANNDICLQAGTSKSGSASAIVDNCHQFPARDDVTQETRYLDNSIEKHVIYVKESKPGSQDPHLNSVCDVDKSTVIITIKFMLQVTSTCIQPAPECSDLLGAAASKELIKDWLPETISPSGSSNPSSEKADLNVAGEELAKSMMCFLLPRAVTLLEKTYVRRKSRCQSHKVKFGPGSNFSVGCPVEEKIASQNFTDSICQGEFEADSFMNESKVKIPETSNDPLSMPYQMTKMEHPNDGCMTYKPFDQSVYWGDAKHMIPDSFEDDKYVSDVHTEKHTTVIEIDGAAYDKTRENNITSTPVIQAETVGPSNSEIVLLPNNTNKNEYFLTDSLVDCLEEAANDDLFFAKENVSDAISSLGACVNNDMPYLNPGVVENVDSRTLNTEHGEDALEEMVIPEYTLDHNNCRNGTEQCFLPENTSSDNLGERGTSMFVKKESLHMNGNQREELQTSMLGNSAAEHNDYERRDQIGGIHTLTVGPNGESPVNLKVDSASCSRIPSILLSDAGLHANSIKMRNLSNAPHFSSQCNFPLSESIICRNYIDFDAIGTYFAPGTSKIAGNDKTRPMSGKSNLRVASQVQDMARIVDANVKSSNIDDHFVYCAEENCADSINKLHSSHEFCIPPLQESLKDVPEQSINILDDFSFAVKKQTSIKTIDEKGANLFHKQLNQNGLLDGCSYKGAKSNEELGGTFELVGCYVHPNPVLSMCLRSEEDHLQISVICGLQESNKRYVFIYKAPLKDKGEVCPSFIGYTSLELPLLPGPSNINTTSERSGLQFTPDGQSLVFLGSTKAPLCRVGSTNCTCSMCKCNCHEENAVQIGQVNFGYVLLLAKLTTFERLSCILVCEPNYLITAGVSGTLHIWSMNCNWREALEEFALPSFNYSTPAIELKTIPKSNSLIVGHDGAGSFGLWDISKRILLSRFSIPGSVIFQILPIGMFSFEDMAIPSTCQEMKLMQETLEANYWVTETAASPLQLREDIAIGLLVSTASHSEAQVDHHLKEPNMYSNRCWRLALLIKSIVVMGSVLDKRASSVDASADYGIIGTYDGLLYKWELSSGKKLANLLHLKWGSILCTSVDAESGVLAVADDKCRLLILKQV